jgi:hypothetical protein
LKGDSVSVNARYAQEYRNSIEDLKTAGTNHGIGQYL